MDEIVSLVVANGIFAVLFCGLLIFELRDSRNRESRYMHTINALNERLKTVDSVRTDTAEIKTDVDEIKTDAKILRSDAEQIKHVVVTVGKPKGGASCKNPIAV